MKGLIYSGAAVFAVCLGYATLSAQTAQPTTVVRLKADATSHQALVQQYCVTCHSQRLKTGGLVLEPAALATPSTNIEPVVYINSANGKRVKPGMEVQVSPTTVPVQ